MSTATTCTGVVTRFGAGWGFIRPDHGDGDVFVHYSGLVGQDPRGSRNLIPGQRVSFKTVRVEGKRLPCAVEVRVVG